MHLDNSMLLRYRNYKPRNAVSRKMNISKPEPSHRFSNPSSIIQQGEGASTQRPGTSDAFTRSPLSSATPTLPMTPAAPAAAAPAAPDGRIPFSSGSRGLSQKEGYWYTRASIIASKQLHASGKDSPDGKVFTRAADLFMGATNSAASTNSRNEAAGKLRAIEHSNNTFSKKIEELCMGLDAYESPGRI
jgi:hypothetical protein